jgi:hypothetical protein
MLMQESFECACFPAHPQEDDVRRYVNTYRRESEKNGKKVRELGHVKDWLSG